MVYLRNVFEFVAPPHEITPEEMAMIRATAVKHGTTDLVALVSPDGFMVAPREYALRTAPSSLTKGLGERPTAPADRAEALPGHTWIWFLQILYKVPSLDGRGGIQVNMLPVDFNDPSGS